MEWIAVGRVRGGGGRARTVFVPHRLADRHRRLLVRVLKDHDLRQLDTQPRGAPSLILALETVVGGGWGALNVPVRNLFGQLRVAVARQEFDGVGRHTWLCVLLLQLELVECLSPHVVRVSKKQSPPKREVG